MLNIKNIILATTMTAMLSSCGSDFLESEPFQNIGSPVAIKNVEDIAVALNGAYYWMGHYGFCGRNLTAVGEIPTDNAHHTQSTTHLTSFYNYSYQETSAELSDIWECGYKVVDHTARIIESANRLLSTVSTVQDSATIHQGLAQAYALRGYATFALTNLFALPYAEANLDAPGVVLVDKPVQPMQRVSRSTLEETYNYVLEQLELASEYAKGMALSNKYFYMNEIAIEAMKARVHLYKGDFALAKTFAGNVVAMRKGSIATSETAYNEMFDKLSGSQEDIFVLAKASDDHLSAYSLNTLYVNYGVSISKNLTALLADTDIRKNKMITYGSKYYGGGKYAQTVTNVPVIRLPEMYLIIAECEAELGNAAAAAEALLQVAKRNTAITSVGDLPSSVDGLKAFIAEERRRELFQEGHRLYDARRTKETILVNGGNDQLINGLYLFPIPANEINAGYGVTQNTNWNEYLPIPVK